MTYPETAGFQHGSKTSESAADSGSIYTYRAAAHKFLQSQGDYGATAKELARHMSEVYKVDIQYTTAGARLTELKRAGKAVETKEVREGSAVVVLREFVKPEPVTSKIKQLREQLERTGHGHVVPRLDGTKERCGGPNVCRACKTEKLYFENLEKKGE